MKYYKKITHWENKRRTDELNLFRKDVVDYFNSMGHTTWNEPYETAQSQDKRRKINLAISKIQKIVHAANVDPVLIYTPPPAIGGYVQRIDVLLNIFNTIHYQIPHNKIIDFIDIAIGRYSDDYNSSILRTFNPFFWIFQIIELVARIPFFLLGLIGFNQNKVEASLYGRIVKGIFTLITAIAAIVTIAQGFGLMDKLKLMLGIN